MNSIKFRIPIISMFLLPLCLVILCSGCNKDDKGDDYSDYLTGYVVGSFIGDEVNNDGQAIGNKTERGYCILHEGNEEKSMDFYTFNLPDDIFVFPEEILSSTYNLNNCGPVFFPDSLVQLYRIRFKYQIKDESEKVKFVTGPCNTMLPPFPWESYNEIYFENVIKD